MTNSWLNDILDAFLKFPYETPLSLSTIEGYVGTSREAFGASWPASASSLIRHTIEMYSWDSKNYNKSGNRWNRRLNPNLFGMVSAGSGLWYLRNPADWAVPITIAESEVRR